MILNENILKDEKDEKVVASSGRTVKNNDELMITRSNVFIRSKFQSTLFMKKIMAIVMSRIVMVDGELIGKTTVAEIKELTGIKGNGVYGLLKVASPPLLQHTIVLDEDDGNEKFHYMNVVTDCKYERGQFTVIFNKRLKEHVLGLTQRFTSSPVKTLCGFNSSYTFRLYELLSAHAWLLAFNREVVIKYSVGELRCEVGTVNIEEKSVKAAINRGVDWNEIADELSSNKIYPKWHEFKRNVLEPAQKELAASEKSEIVFSFKPFGKRDKGKIRTLEIVISENPIYKGTNYSRRKKYKREQMEATLFKDVDARLVEAVKNIFGDYKITEREAVLILNDADNDIVKIENGFHLALSQPEVENIVAFVRKAIQENWKPSLAAMKGSTREHVQVIEDVMEDYTRIRDLYELYKGGKLEFHNLSAEEAEGVMQLALRELKK